MGMRLFLQECGASHQGGETGSTLFVRWIFEDREKESIRSLFSAPDTVFASMNPIRPDSVTLCTRNGREEECFSPKDSWNLTLDELADGILFRADKPQALSPVKQYVQHRLPGQIQQKISSRKNFWLGTVRSA